MELDSVLSESGVLLAILNFRPVTSWLYVTCTHFTWWGRWGNARDQLKCDGTRAETRFRPSAKRTSPFKSAGTSVQSTAGSRVVRICGSNAGYTMFRGSVKGTGYPLHSPVSPSLPLPCVTVCHHISNGVYHICSPQPHFFVTDMRHKPWKWVYVLFLSREEQDLRYHTLFARWICWFCVCGRRK